MLYDGYHAGEREVQARAGVEQMAARVGRSIKDHIPATAQDFLATQPFVIIASSDPQGQVWASVLAGAPGFVRALDAVTVAIAAVPLPDDPLAANLATNPTVGLLAIEFTTRRRMRLNGSCQRQPDGTLVMRADQVYANCPKYIQAREVQATAGPTAPQPSAHQAEHLTPAQQDWVRQADTFFIASAHPEHGADASHRGGQPGFVAVHAAATLVWPDYAGNTMFNTLGNIAAHPQAGLLFLDFATGSTLQVAGHAAIIWDTAQVAQYPDAERLISYSITQVRETRHALPLRWSFENASPFNPPVHPPIHSVVNRPTPSATGVDQ